MTRQPVVGAIQLVATRADKEANLQAIEHHGAAAARDGAVVVVAPEMAVTGYCWPDPEEVRALAEPLDGPSVERLTRLARLTGAWFVVGMPELDPVLGTLHNTCVLVSPDGCQGAYRKIHPFLADPFWAVDGNEPPPVWSTPAGRVVPAICADVDYPEPPRYAAVAGADWLAVPTAWVDEPAPSATWRMRAWENALPVVAADMAGDELGVQFSGGSCILDHQGRPTATIDSGAGHVTARLDLDRAATARADLLASRRPAQYRQLAVSKRWPRRAAENLFGTPPTQQHLSVGVLTAAPDDVPPPPSGLDVAVLPAFHLCGGAPADPGRAQDAARAWTSALERLASLARRHECEVVTSLVEPSGTDALHHTVVAVDPAGDVATHRATHLGAHAGWATPGAGPGVPMTRPWGRLGLLSGEELEPWEPAHVLALRDTDVLAVPAAVTWPLPVAFAGTSVPLPDALSGPDPHFAHPVRLRAGESHLWIGFANAQRDDSPPRVPSGIFSPDHIRAPRVEAVSQRSGWEVLRCPTRAPDELGEICESKPQLLRRRPDVMAAPLITPQG
ncbi:nitrilase-related carbon-nitrogen hydrolase [Nocardioides sp. SYSU DS0663]|uniref:nitrilase-related carbon-nitrogen hydrolase n=1 Tax=Nocardioides sp. SYSU DS0663 TaxID=3416445 RepID=UPI003F4BAE9C